MDKRYVSIFILVLSSILYSITAQGGDYYIPVFWNSQAGSEDWPLLTTNAWTAWFSSDGNIEAITGPLYLDYPRIYQRGPNDLYTMSGENITLSCNVSDNNWLKNITYYSNASGSWKKECEKNLTGFVDSSECNITTNKTFSWYCVSCDIFGFCTVAKNWTIYSNISLPNVTLISPGNASNKVEGNINFTCNASDPDGIANITIKIWNEGGTLVHQETKTTTGNGVEENFTASLSEGNYTWNCGAYDTKGYYGEGKNKFTIYVHSSAVPSIVEAWARPPVIINGSSVILYMSVMNANNLSANITLPNGSTELVKMEDKTNITFNNTNLTGRYNVTFIAHNNYTNQIVYAYDFFISSPEMEFNLSVINSTGQGINASLKIEYDEWVYYDSSSNNGNFSITLPNWTFNITVEGIPTSIKIFFNKMNISADNGETLGIDKEEKVGENIYGFNSTITSPDGENLYLPYAPLSPPFVVTKCGSFDFANMSCGGTSTGVSGNVEGGFFVISTTSLGEEGYKIKEEQQESKPKGGEGEKKKDKELEIIITTKGCVEEPVKIEVRDKETEEGVEGRILIKNMNFFWSTVAEGEEYEFQPEYTGRYYVNVRADGYIEEDEHFDLESCYECQENKDCAENEICKDHECIGIICECGIITNHTCNAFECCSDNDCEGKKCYEHFCVDCISDEDCEEGFFCNEDHTCIQKEVPKEEKEKEEKEKEEKKEKEKEELSKEEIKEGEETETIETKEQTETKILEGKEKKEGEREGLFLNEEEIRNIFSISFIIILLALLLYYKMKRKKEKEKKELEKQWEKKYGKI